MAGPQPKSFALNYGYFSSGLSPEARTIHLVGLAFMASMGFEEFRLGPVQIEYLPFFAYGDYWRRSHLDRVVKELIDAGYWETVDSGYRLVGGLARIGDSLRKPLSPETRREVMQRDNGICQLCFGPVDADAIHIDHRRPVAAGGGDHLENLQVTHWRCNLRKAAHIQ